MHILYSLSYIINMHKTPIHLLNAFVVFGDSKNIVEAASRLQITQPALSKQLKQLEESLPGPVFTLVGRKKTLTVFGRNLYHQLKGKLGNIQDLVEQTWSLHSDARQATVKVAARRGILDRISAHIEFDGAIFFLELSNEDILKSLLNLECEIGIVHKIPNTHELIAKPLFKEDFQLVIPKGLLPKSYTFGEELFSLLSLLPCLGYRPDDEILKAVCKFNSAEVHKLKMVRATENYSSIAEMIEARLGWAVMPTYLKVSESKNWVISIPARAYPSRQFYLVYRPEFNSVSWFKSLISEIRTCFTKEQV